jgi:splicing factor 3A subunit 1
MLTKVRTPSPLECTVCSNPRVFVEVIEITARHVALRGVSFEAEILSRHANDSKFGFLSPDSPYCNYYKVKVASFLDLCPDPDVLIAQYRQGQNGEIRSETTPQVLAEEEEEPTIEEEEVRTQAKPQAQPQQRQQDVYDGVIAGASLPHIERIYQDVLMSKKPDHVSDHPPNLEFYDIGPPESLLPIDVEIMKLTARFYARNGARFLSGLTAREHRNPQFDFLKATHVLYPYFQKLVDAYSRIINPSQAALAELESNSGDWYGVYRRILPDAEHERLKVEKERAAQEGDEQDRRAMAMIDWFDFVVAGTVPVTDAELSGEDGGVLESSCLTTGDLLRFITLVTAPQAPVEVEDDDGDDMDMD